MTGRQSVALALLVLCLVSAGAHAPAVASAEVTLAEYRGALDDAAGLVARARSVDEATRDQLARDAATRLEAITAVRLDDGTLVQPSYPELLAALRTAPPDLDAADTRLGALREAVGRAIPADQSSAPQQQAVLRGVLARPEFQPEPQADYGPILGTLLAILWALQRYVDEQVGRLYQLYLDVLAGRISVATVLVALAALGLVFVGIWYVARRIGASIAPESREPERAAVAGVARAGETWRQALGRAEAGDYRGGVRLLYLATLQALDEAGRLRFRPTLTNREHLVEAPGELRPLLEPLVGRYDRLWYGQSSCAEADYLEFRALATRLREAMR